MGKWTKTGKKNRNFIKASDTKKRRAVQYFNRCCLLLMAVVLVSFAVCSGRPYELQEASAHGPALWFLLLMAYPILGVLGLVNIIFGWGDTAVVEYFTVEHPALGLTLLNEIYLGAIWVLVRRRGLGWFGPGGIRAAGNFVLIMACWGAFQLFLVGLMMLWYAGGLSPFHPEARENSPAVVAKSGPASGAPPGAR